MRKIAIIALLALAFGAWSACGKQDEDRTTEQMDAEAEIEVDTAITQDPDTTTYHDMTL